MRSLLTFRCASTSMLPDFSIVLHQAGDTDAYQRKAFSGYPIVTGASKYPVAPEKLDSL